MRRILGITGLVIALPLAATCVRAQWGQPGLMMTGGGSGPSGPTLVQSWPGNNSSNGHAACTNNICAQTLTHTIAAGHTVVGYVHGANGDDNAPMYPQSIKDQNGTNLNFAPAAEWTPFHEDIGVWYLQNVPETITSITWDFSQYNGTLDTGSFVDTGYAEYANVQSLVLVDPFASNSATPSLTITPTSPALIWTVGAFYVGSESNTDSSIRTSGYTTIVGSAGNNIAIWGSNGSVPASSQTITYSNPVGPPGTCADWAPHGCSAVLAAVALQSGSGTWGGGGAATLVVLAKVDDPRN